MDIRESARRTYRRIQGERRAKRAGGRRSTDAEPNEGWGIVLALALPIALVDWAVKWLVVQLVPLNAFIEWSDRVAIWHVKNPALVLGLHGDLPMGWRRTMAALYAVLAVMLLLAIFGRGQRLLPRRRKWAWVFIGMLGGGMLGNLGERALYWGVTDYLSFRWGDLWLPPGNVADLSILLALPIAAAILYFELEARALRGAGDDEEPEPDAPAERVEVPSPG